MMMNWNDLGVNEGGLPIHFPMGHTRMCEGPTDDADAHHWACWCPAGHSCPLSVALGRAGQAGYRRGVASSSSAAGVPSRLDHTGPIT